MQTGLCTHASCRGGNASGTVSWEGGGAGGAGGEREGILYIYKNIFYKYKYRERINGAGAIALNKQRSLRLLF